MRFLVVFITLFSLCSVGFAQQKSTGVYLPTKIEMEVLISELSLAVNPDSPENAYMPSFLKEKIRWIHLRSNERIARGEKGLISLAVSSPRTGSALSMTTYSLDSLPYIIVFADRWFSLVREEDKFLVGYSKSHKNSFAYALAHEAIHLEQPKSFLEKPPTREVMITEEFRVWSKADQFIVRPLLEAGQPIDSNLGYVSKILQKCVYKMPCKEFADFIVYGKGGQ